MKINKNISETLEDLRPLSNDLIDNNLRVNVPTRIEFNYTRKNRFTDAHRLLKGAFSLQDSTLLLTGDIPFNINRLNRNYIDTLDVLVNKNFVHPFLFFINGVFIKWSDIYIIKDPRYSYILLPKHREKNAKYDMILIPKNIEYTERGLYNEDKTLFSFYDGYLYKGIERCVTISKSDVCDFYYEDLKLESGHIQHFNIDSNYEIATDNIIVFKNNMLYTDDIINYGLNMFSVDNNDFGNVDYYAKGFFYYGSNKRVNNSNVIMNKDSVIKNITSGNTIPRYYDIFNEKFNLSFNIKNDYETNILEGLYNTMYYNSSLMNGVYKRCDKTISKIYTGAELKKLSYKGKITMSRRINGNIHNYVMIFHNGSIYKHYFKLEYNHRDFTFPFEDINDDDTIEILYFLNVDNRDIHIKFGSRLEDRYFLDESIELDNMKLFTMQPENLQFNIEVNPDKLYEIGFKYKKEKDGTSIIYPDKPFYYDKRLHLSSKRQFHYVRHVCNIPIVDFILPMEFKFCNNRNQYIIFINGRKIDKKFYNVVTPSVDSPMDDLSIYFNRLLRVDDIVEIFYLPDRLYECSIDTKLESNGSIYLDKSKLNHNISKDLNFIFVNGRKIPKDWIYDVNQTMVQLTTDPESIYNLCIIQHIDPDELVSSIFSSTDDLITTNMNELNDAELKKIITDINVTIKDTDIVHNEVDKKKVLYRLVEDYYCQPFVSTGDNFIFEESDLFDEVDRDDNIVIRQDDANLEDKLGKE